MDRKSLIAVALCVLFLIAYPQILKLAGLDKFMAPPKPAATTTVASKPADSTLAAAATPAADSARAAGKPLGSLTAVAPPDQPRSSATPAGQAPTTTAPPGLSAMTPAAAAGAGEIEKNWTIVTPLYRATFSSRGARLLAMDLQHYAAGDAAKHAGASSAGDAYAAAPGPHDEPVEGPHVTLAGGPSFALDLGSGNAVVPLGDVAYAVTESLDASGATRALTFVARDETGFSIRQTWRARQEDYALDLEVEIQNVPAGMRVTDYSMSTRTWPLLTETNQEADEHALKASCLVGTNIHREHPNQLNKGPKAHDGNVVWAAVQSRYFLGAIAVKDADARGVSSSAAKRPLTASELAQLGPKAKAEQDVAISSLIVALPGRERPVHKFLVYFGPSEYFRLSALGVQLERAVDMGWNWILPFSKALLWLLNWLYSLVHNYGVAILALATIVRVGLHPLNVAGMKSMRNMQKLQPEMERIREKYKSDPQAMNTATMALYKEHKVNPASGCLPMLLQMPLFLALYQVLFNAIELRRAPFVAWMQDLSAPDLAFEVAGFPIRILPLLMAGSGLLQQMVTPTDPRQRTTMYMMNVVMVVFFYNLPSGLVLYWTVMNLLTALQQWMVLRQDSGPLVMSPAPAAASGRKR